MSATTAIAPAATRSTAAAPRHAISAAFTSGPTVMPIPSAELDTELAALSSWGVAARSGRSALWTGRVRVTAHADRIAVAYTAGAGPARRASPHAAAASACTR